jgi:regulator of protease activity HflC (stomatin/prohibitin superfamily)
MNSISILSRRLIVMPLILLLLVAGAGCKSKKKAMEAAAAEKARMEQEAALKQQQEAAERRRQEEVAEADRLKKEQAEREARASGPSVRLEEYFAQIANSPTSASANGSIQEALSMFASEDTPVLIVISEEGGVKDYDRPTTIRAYLNYLKDVKKNTNRIGKLHFDSSNKIVEVELIKGR